MKCVIFIISQFHVEEQFNIRIHCHPLSLPYGSRYGSARTALEKSTAKSSENKEKPLISGEISGDLVAGAGFEPTAFGL